MLRYAADEDFNAVIVRGLRRRLTQLDLVRVRDVHHAGVDDPDVLAWAAGEGRVLWTHDASTMTDAAYRRIARSEVMPGVLVVPQLLEIGSAIEDLVLIVECAQADDFRDQVRFLPLG
jgi:hypothetical protein